MSNRKCWILIFILNLMLMLISCFGSSIKYTTNEGKLSESDIITVDYSAKSSKGFYASLDFELEEGKVNWEIINPQKELVFIGYVIFEDGKVYRELTYPLHSGWNLNNKEEVKSETDTKGNIINIPDFNYLQFEAGSLSGEYRLNLKPTNAKGSFKMQWSDKLPRK